MQKSGSQWFKTFFNDPQIKSYTNLLVFPQHRYEWGYFIKNFPKGTFVPGLYMGYDLFEEINRDPFSQTICVIRDPRNIVISWYFSMLESHILMGKVNKYRNDLTKLSLNEGLHYSIEALAVKLIEMRTWFRQDAMGDKTIQRVYFEEFFSDKQIAIFIDIINKMNLKIPKNLIVKKINYYSKENMRLRDKEVNPSRKGNHYRKRSSNHHEYFTKKHYEHFYKTTGNLIEVLGYK